MERAEIFMRTERRRKHSRAFRELVLSEAARPDLTIKSVAQMYDVAESLIYTWRMKYRGRVRKANKPLQVLNGADSAAPIRAAEKPDFMFAGQIPETASQCNGGDRLGPDFHARQFGQIEMRLPNGISLFVDDQFNEQTLKRALFVLEARL
jgi:transposase-like protein